MNTICSPPMDRRPPPTRSSTSRSPSAHDTGARIEVLTVRTLAAHGDPEAPRGDHMDLQPVVEQIASEAACHAHDLGVEASARTAYGSPAPMIAETAKALGVDLVVVGSHGRGPHGVRARKRLTRAGCRRARFP